MMEKSTLKGFSITLPNRPDKKIIVIKPIQVKIDSKYVKAVYSLTLSYRLKK